MHNQAKTRRDGKQWGVRSKERDRSLSSGSCVQDAGKATSRLETH